jgi:5'-nucleotidase
VLVLPRGRSHATTPGDENSVVDGGFVSINRLNWFGQTRLGDELVASL